MEDTNLMSLRELTEALVIKDIELKESAKKFSAIFCINPLPMCLSTSAEGKLLEINNAYVECFKYTREEVIGKTSIELGILNIKDREIIATEICVKGHIFNREIELKKKDGSMLTSLLSIKEITLNKIRCWLVVIVNITNIRQDQRRNKQVGRNEDNLTDFNRHEEDYEIENEKGI